MRVSIEGLASAAAKARAERHRRQEEFKGIELGVLEDMLRMPSVDAGVRADIADWIVQLKRQVKVDLDRKETHAASMERLALPVMVVVFGVLTWVAQTMDLGKTWLVVFQMGSFAACSTVWWAVRKEALESIKSAKKQQALLGKVD